MYRIYSSIPHIQNLIMPILGPAYPAFSGQGRCLEGEGLEGDAVSTLRRAGRCDLEKSPKGRLVLDRALNFIGWFEHFLGTNHFKFWESHLLPRLLLKLLSTCDGRRLIAGDTLAFQSCKLSW